MLRRTLSPEERERADRRGGAADRRWFVADHGLRRALLSDWIGCAPEQVAYEVDAQGKPRLVGESPHFSASRAGPVALYAVSASAQVGVDVESIAHSDDSRALARRLMSATEHAAWEAMSAARRPGALCECWTRKEAYGKALGSGLVFPLSEIEVWAGDDRPMRHGEVSVHAVDLASRGVRAEVSAQLRGAVAVRCVPARPIEIAPVVTLPGAR